MRFDKTNPWKKVLFLPDRRLQSPELIEIQDVVNYETCSAFNYLYYYYYITKIFNISIDNINNDSITITLSEGQVYINLPEVVYSFVDVKSQSIEVSSQEDSIIGINFELEEIEDNSLKDPLTGGMVFGDYGATRKLVNYSININQDSYPIAYISPRGSGRVPEITYYNNQKFLKDTDYYYSSFPQEILEYVYLRHFETYGNYIAQGLIIHRLTDNSIGVSCGKAFIKGFPICSNQIFIFKFSRFEKRVYSLYINTEGQIKVTESLEFINKYNYLLIGKVVVDDSVQILNSKSRALSELTLLNYYNNSFDNTKKILESYQIRNKLNNSNVTNEVDKVIIDNFNSTEGSNIFDSIFNASLDTTAGRLLPSLVKTPVKITKDNITFTNNVEIYSENSIINLEGDIKYFSPLSTRFKFLSQNISTDILSLNNSTNNSVYLNISPDVSYPNLSEKSVTVSTGTANKGVLTLATSSIYLEASGLKPSEDNLQITFGNTSITEFNVLKGTQFGSTTNTIKASADGLVYVDFQIPASLPFDNYIVSLGNNRISSSTMYSMIGEADTSNKQAIKDIKGSVGQTFTIDNYVTINSIHLYFRKVPSIIDSELVLGRVYLLPVEGEIISSNLINEALISYSDIVLSENGMGTTELEFNYPSTLNPGKYAFILDIYQNDVEIFYARTGKPSLNTPGLSASKLLTRGELFKLESNEYKYIPDSDLTFEIIASSADSLISSIEFNFDSPLNEINTATKFIQEKIPTSTLINYYYKSNNEWKAWNTDTAYLEKPSSNLDFKVEFVSSRDKTPIIKNSNSLIVLNYYSKQSTWVSVNKIFSNIYTNVEVEFDIYQPASTEIFVLFSSNLGETWNAIPLVESTLVDGNIPLYRNQYLINNLTPIVKYRGLNNTNFEKERREIILRIDFNLNNNSFDIPYCSNLISTVY